MAVDLKGEFGLSISTTHHIATKYAKFKAFRLVKRSKVKQL